MTEDALAEWMQSACIIGVHSEAPARDLWQSFIAWEIDQAPWLQKRMSQKRFGHLLRAMGCRSRKSMGRIIYVGIALQPKAPWIASGDVGRLG